MNSISQELSAQEKRDLQSEYVEQVRAGTMSGRELIDQLRNVCALDPVEASSVWSTIKSDAPIYQAKIGDTVQACIGGRWQPVKITSTYLSFEGAVVEMIEAPRARLPFSRFELRVS